jgi:hypothetical protein
MISTWQEFAEVTIRSNDLDPMYDVIYGIRQDYGWDVAARFSLAFTTFYHAGFAAKVMAENPSDFWGYMLDNYWTAPRGTERRHFRGANGETWLRNIAELGPPEEILKKWHRPTYSYFLDAITPRCGYGPYFAWKLLDIYERCLGMPMRITLEEAVKYMPDEPKACAKALWPDVSFPYVVAEITNYISQWKAPPGRDRPCSYQETETILCMIKGFFLTKSHVVGDDIAEKRASLKDFPALVSYLPEPVKESDYGRAPELGPQRLSTR